MSGITKTIPQKEGIAAVEALYHGPTGEFEFHMAGKPSRLNVGDYVYTICKTRWWGVARSRGLSLALSIPHPTNRAV